MKETKKNKQGKRKTKDRAKEKKTIMLSQNGVDEEKENSKDGI